MMLVMEMTDPDFPPPLTDDFEAARDSGERNVEQRTMPVMKSLDPDIPPRLSD